MTDEVIEQQESTQEQDDAAFNAGFAEVRGDETPPTESVEPEVKEPEEKEPEVAAVEAQPEQPPEELPVLAGLTESQIKAALAKMSEMDDMKLQVRQAFGKLGELNQKLMQAQTATAKLSPGQLSKLASEFPEMARLLEEDLSSLSVGSQPSFDPQPLQKELAETRHALAQARAESEMKLLSITHRDWRSIANSDDFRIWSQTLSGEERQKLNDSWDALYLTDKLTEFKSWKGKGQAVQQQKQNRLAQAVTPTGAPKSAPNTINDDDAFLAGWKSVRR